MSKEYKRPTFEEEYLRVERDKAFEYLESKIGATEIDGRVSMSEKRKWFMHTFDHAADDETVCKAWRER